MHPKQNKPKDFSYLILSCVFSPDGGIHLYVVWFLVPDVSCDRGSGSGAGYATGEYVLLYDCTLQAACVLPDYINVNDWLLVPCHLANFSFLILMQDSYMLEYFKYLYKYFEVGVPTYFVTTKGFNFTTVDGMNAVCSSVGCDQFSLTQKIQYATEYPEL